MHIGTLPLASTTAIPPPITAFTIPDSRIPIPGPQPRIASTVISSRS
ncbi:hypothetical protein FHT15_001904 [Xanthomonas campestris]